MEQSKTHYPKPPCPPGILVLSACTKTCHGNHQEALKCVHERSRECRFVENTKTIPTWPAGTAADMKAAPPAGVAEAICDFLLDEVMVTRGIDMYIAVLHALQFTAAHRVQEMNELREAADKFIRESSTAVPETVKPDTADQEADDATTAAYGDGFSCG